MVTHGLWDINGLPCLETPTEEHVIIDDPLCSICLNATSNEEDFLTTCCLSKFHHDCLNGWIRAGSGTCPNCRSDISNSIPLFM